MLKHRSNLRASKATEKGAAMVEYGIVVALIAVVSVMVVGALGADAVSAMGHSKANVNPGASPLGLAA